MSAVSHTARKSGSRSRRWTDEEIRRAVLSVSGGKPISRMAYKLARRDLDPDRYPTHNTVYARCPDLFQT